MPSQVVITKTQLDSLIKEYELVFVDFWAEWCAPCKQFSRIYEQASEQFPVIAFVKVNIEEQQDLAEFYDIRSIPHLMIFKEGIIIYSNAGSMPESILNELARQSLNTEVSEIRDQLLQDKL